MPDQTRTGGVDARPDQDQRCACQTRPGVAMWSLLEPFTHTHDLKLDLMMQGLERKIQETGKNVGLGELVVAGNEELGLGDITDPEERDILVLGHGSSTRQTGAPWPCGHHREPMGASGQIAEHLWKRWHPWSNILLKHCLVAPQGHGPSGTAWWIHTDTPL